MDAAAVAGVSIQRLTLGASGRPLLYLHPKDGPGDDRPFLEALASAGFAVHAPWLPGFGHSERPDGFETVRDLACFGAAYLDEIAADGALVVGASFGGWVAADMATRDLSRIAGFVLIDALGLKFGAPDQREIADFHNAKAEEIARSSWVNPARHGPPDGLNDDEALAAARSEEAFALYGWRPYMHDPGLGRWLKRVDCPALVLWGEADGVVSTDYGGAYADLFPDGRFQTITGAAHYPTREQPAETAARIAAFAESF